MRTIGILGGMGPQATMDFEAIVRRALDGPRIDSPSAYSREFLGFLVCR